MRINWPSQKSVDPPVVFVSYSRRDRAFVDRLASALHKKGVNTWVDTQNILPGSDFSQSISHALQQASVLLLVASVHSGTSAWVLAEVQAFAAGGGTVIPLIIDDEGESSLPAHLQTVQWVDFRQDFGGAIDTLVRGIQGRQTTPISEPREPTTPIPEPRELSKGYVFISYSTEDDAFVGELKTFLAGRGYSYWDFHTSKRNFQIDFTLELEDRIRNAEATLSVISPSWKKSRTALQELHFSKDVDTPVFLLRLADPGPTLAIAGLTFIDFIKSREQGFSKLAGEMQEVGL